LSAEPHDFESLRKAREGEGAVTSDALLPQSAAAHPDHLFDDLTLLAAEVCSTPAAILSVGRAGSLQHVSRIGSLPACGQEDGLISQAMLQNDIYVATDLDGQTAKSSLRFFAGAPLSRLDGSTFGALSVIDEQPRELNETQTRALRSVAAAVQAHFELKRASIELEQARADQEKALKLLAASEKRCAMLLRGTSDGMWEWDLKTNEMHFCERWKAMLGYGAADLGSHPDEWFNRVHPEDIERLQSEIMTHILGSSTQFQSEHRVRRSDGTYRWMLSRGLAALDSNRLVYRMTGSLTDITEQKQAEKQLLHNAFHDALTGLPNRALFMDRLKDSSAEVKKGKGYSFGVLFLDLDRFKIVNDSLGHQIGDQLLVATARRIESCLRPGDIVARLGGDEFAVILDHVKHVSDAVQAAERIRERLASPFNLSGHEVLISASIGIALNQTASEEPDEILRNADTAMYRAKDQGRGCFELFDKGKHSRGAAHSELETGLRRALARDEFRVHYQPIISLENWRISGFEALLRWEHPEHGYISPLKFIPVAEECGLIIEVGQWVLREACRQLRVWQEQFPSDPPLSIAVNLSGKQFSQPDLIDCISQILKETGLDANSLKLEITESSIIENIDTAAMVLKRIKALGARLSLDDFGTGYASLSYLHRFPIDTLKIDRSFVSRINLPKNAEMIKTILMLARNLGMDVVAEGVETREQVLQLTGLNCEFVQGYLLSKPIDGRSMRDLISKIYNKGLSADGAQAEG
jgi:diguanylate cyclase (GGDEF)-like protein/PAS domain S-box-containing protein